MSSEPPDGPEPSRDTGNADRPEPPEPPERPAMRDYVIAIEAGIATVVVVLGAAFLTGVLPEPLQRVVFHTPLAIAVLIVGTGWVLWRVARPGR